MNNLSEVLKNNTNGLYYGNRILLPFEAEILKIVIDAKIITDFSSTSEDAEYLINEGFTEIYIFDFDSVEEVVSEFENIKMVVVEKGKNLFDFANHIKISASLGGNHNLLIKELDEDILFIE